MPVALITGANGFIGSNLAKELLEKGWQVKGLILPGTSTEFIDNLDIEIFYGDVTNPDTLRECCKNTGVIFHLAALATDWGKPEIFFRVNSEGTRNLIISAIKQDVSRFVLMSSITVHEYSGHYKATEDVPRDCPEYFAYGQSKIKAEDYLNEFHAQKKIEGVIIRPGLMPFGPNDTTSFYKLAKVLEKGYFSYINGGKAKMSTAYIENLCYGLHLAGLKPQAAGQTYIIADDEELTWKELIEKFCQKLGVKPPFLSVPYFLGNSLAVLMEKFWQNLKLSGEPPITRYRASVMHNDLYFVADKAKRELGYRQQISVDRGIEKTVDWYRNYKKNKF